MSTSLEVTSNAVAATSGGTACFTDTIEVPTSGAGELVLGRWQRVFLVEFDRPRLRRVALQAIGVGGERA